MDAWPTPPELVPGNRGAVRRIPGADFLNDPEHLHQLSDNKMYVGVGATVDVHHSSERARPVVCPGLAEFSTPNSLFEASGHGIPCLLVDKDVCKESFGDRGKQRILGIEHDL